MSTTDAAAVARRTDLAGGARAIVPWLSGIVPFGFAIGVAAAQAHIPLLAGWLTGPLLFGGSAQILTIQLLNSGTTPAVVVVAALAINLRLVLYSGSMARHWSGEPRWWQALAAYLLIDPTLAVGIDGYDTMPSRTRAHRHYIGAGVTLLAAWLVAMTAGAMVGSSVPAGLHLEMVIPLFLIGEVVHRSRDMATTSAVLAAVAVAVLAASMPLHLGPIAAIVAGVGVAVSLQPFSKGRR